MRRLAVARNRGLQPVGRPRRARAPAVAARSVGGFHRCHHSIGDRTGCVDERLDGVRHRLTWSQDVALDRVEHVGARHLALNILRHVPVAQAGVPGAPPLQIEDAELTALECRIRAEQRDDRSWIRAFLQFLKHQHLVLMRAVHSRLAGRNALAGHDHGLDAFQEFVVLVDTGCRCDDDTAGARIGCDDRPGGERGGRRGKHQRQDQQGRSHWRSPDRSNGGRF